MFLDTFILNKTMAENENVMNSSVFFLFFCFCIQVWLLYVVSEARGFTIWMMLFWQRSNFLHTMRYSRYQKYETVLTDNELFQ